MFSKRVAVLVAVLLALCAARAAYANDAASAATIGARLSSPSCLRMK